MLCMLKKIPFFLEVLSAVFMTQCPHLKQLRSPPPQHTTAEHSIGCASRWKQLPEPITLHRSPGHSLNVKSPGRQKQFWIQFSLLEIISTKTFVLLNFQLLTTIMFCALKWQFDGSMNNIDFQAKCLHVKNLCPAWADTGSFLFTLTWESRSTFLRLEIENTRCWVQQMTENTQESHAPPLIMVVLCQTRRCRWKQTTAPTSEQHNNCLQQISIP